MFLLDALKLNKISEVKNLRKGDIGTPSATQGRIMSSNCIFNISKKVFLFPEKMSAYTIVF